MGKEVFVTVSKLNNEHSIIEILNMIEECINNILELRNTNAPSEKLTELPEEYKNINLAEAIRIDRHRRRLTMYEYSKNIGIAQSTLSRYEHGQGVPSDLAVLKKIIDYTQHKAI